MLDVYQDLWFSRLYEIRGIDSNGHPTPIYTFEVYLGVLTMLVDAFFFCITPFCDNVQIHLRPFLGNNGE